MRFNAPTRDDLIDVLAAFGLDDAAMLDGLKYCISRGLPIGAWVDRSPTTDEAPFAYTDRPIAPKTKPTRIGKARRIRPDPVQHYYVLSDGRGVSFSLNEDCLRCGSAVGLFDNFERLTGGILCASCAITLGGPAPFYRI